MSIIISEVQSIGAYLQNKNLEIPPFQRPYKWTTRNVIQLLEDIHRFKTKDSYRIGTIVVFKNKDKYQIVDGQQRTITFLLIVKAILLDGYSQLKDDDLKNALNTINDAGFNPSFRNEQSKINIRNNFREIGRRSIMMDEDFIKFFLYKCSITFFVIDDISEAFQLFDSQNARGKDLEPHDLLKAFHLRELEIVPGTNFETQVATLVGTWESMDMKKLATLFSNFLYRVRGWSKGDSSRYFTKKDVPLFKGITLATVDNYPYVQQYRMVASHLEENKTETGIKKYPFQLDQVIINGKHFFEMVSYYAGVFDDINNNRSGLSTGAQKILSTLDSYDGRNRTGDKYVRMLFNCALLYYIDKFGIEGISGAVEKIFIWAYRVRLTYQTLQLASVDNHVVTGINLFKIIRNATYKEEILSMELPLIREDEPSEKTAELKVLFIRMKYYENEQ